MKIEHIAIWCNDIELMRSFYIKYFECESNEIYHNPIKQYFSYFLTFANGGSRIELMTRPDIVDTPNLRGFIKGFAHIDIEVGEAKDVIRLTEEFRGDGYTVAGEPRLTGDGYFESAILDPEGNYIELSAIKNM